MNVVRVGKGELGFVVSHVSWKQDSQLVQGRFEFLQKESSCVKCISAADLALACTM